jgi:hypothetical protein
MYRGQKFPIDILMVTILVVTAAENIFRCVLMSEISILGCTAYYFSFNIFSVNEVL